MSFDPGLKQQAGGGLRLAILIGGIAGAFAAYGSPVLDIRSPGLIPHVFLAVALLIARPAFHWKQLTRGMQAGTALVLAAFVLVAIAALLFSPEREAALLAAPRWAFVLGALVAGLALRHCVFSVVACTVVSIALLRGWGAWQSGLDWSIEITWWAPSLLWLAGIGVVGSVFRAKPLPDSAGLMAAIAWFVLAMGTMTIQEARHPFPHFFSPDRDALFGAVEDQPVLGWGLGGSERVFLETAQRDPDSGPMAARTILRLLTEIGGLPMLLLVAGGIFVAVRTLGSPQWTPARFAWLGIAGFFCLALISSRSDWSAHLAILALAFSATFSPGEDESPSSKPQWSPALVGAIPGLLIGMILWGGQWQFERQSARQTLEARSFLSAWTTPLRHRAVELRDGPHESLTQEEVGEGLEDLARQWVAVSPHDEYGWIELVRVIHTRYGPERAEAVALEATEHLPWSNPLAAWYRRILMENDKPREALCFLEGLLERRGSLPPALHGRMLELRLYFREVGSHGD